MAVVLGRNVLMGSTSFPEASYTHTRLGLGPACPLAKISLDGWRQSVMTSSSWPLKKRW